MEMLATPYALVELNAQAIPGVARPDRLWGNLSLAADTQISQTAGIANGGSGAASGTNSPGIGFA